MAVDDVAVGALQAELPQQRLADLRVVVELVVDVLGSAQVDSSARKRRSKVVMRSRPKMGLLRPAHRNHRKSMPAARSAEPGAE